MITGDNEKRFQNSFNEKKEKLDQALKLLKELYADGFIINYSVQYPTTHAPNSTQFENPV